jgi:Undecaprenyl-phosphate glucose phosphotransferase
MLKRLGEDTTEKPRTILPPLSATTVATILLAADSVAVLGSGFFTYDRLIVYSASQYLYMATVLFVWLVTLSLMNFGGLYRYEVSTYPLRHLHAILIAVATSFLFLLAAAFSIKSSDDFSRLWLGSFAAASLVSITLIRLGISHALARILHVSGSKRNLAIVGTGEQCRRITEMLAHMPDRPMRIQGIFTDSRHAVEPAAGNRMVAIPPDGDLKRLVSQTRRGLIDDVVIAIPWSEDDRIMNVVSKLRELPVNVYLVSDLVGFRTEFRSPPSHFGALPVLQVVGKPMSGWDAVIKAVEDYLLASLILILAAPVLVFIAAAIKLGSPGPVFFRQKRLGYNNQVFEVYKFRTMHHGSEPTDRTRQATPDDLRVTSLGRFLRRWSLDELPQIFNVLNGTMSLVGPRPHAVAHNEQFARRTKGYFARHRVKPGITGLAQVRGFRGQTDTEEKLEGRVRNDIFYAENWSLSLDAWILLRTLVICVSGNNAY